MSFKASQHSRSPSLFMSDGDRLQRDLTQGLLVLCVCVPVGACAHSWGLQQGDLTVFFHTLVSAELSCPYLHQATPITLEKRNLRARKSACLSAGAEKYT